MAMSGSLEQAVELLKGAPRVWIGTHVDPDGDAIGSALGLGLALRRRGTAVAVCCADPPPQEASFLPSVGSLEARPPADGEAIVAVDAAEATRLGRLYRAQDWPGASLAVDHHASNGGYGALNVIDPTRSSTAEVVLEILEAAGMAVDADIATCLLTGIVTDTVGFRTQNTTAATLAAAQRLLGRGARLGDVTFHVFYQRPLASLRLTALALERIELTGPFAITWLELRDLEATGATPDAARGISSLLASAAEPAVVALLRETADGTIDVSLRSKPGVNLVPAAMSMGGGGHAQAAGARLPGPLADARQVVLSALATLAAVPERRTDGGA
jgi:phosphoesterase RecJ-like protein